jgi:hypothetical protein
MCAKFNEGDVVIIPQDVKRKRSLHPVCVVRKIVPTPGQEWVYLVGLLKNGTPSTSSKNSAYYNLSILDKLLPHTKYPKVHGCPKCIQNKQQWWEVPLQHIKRQQFHCRQCNRVWIQQEGELIEKHEAP